MIAYRPHRGSLEDAMKEARTFLNEWQMKRYVANNWNLAIGRKVLDPEDIIIDSESTDDDRVGWKNVHMVCADVVVQFRCNAYLQRLILQGQLVRSATEGVALCKYLVFGKIKQQVEEWVVLVRDFTVKCRGDVLSQLDCRFGILVSHAAFLLSP